jgi:ferritin-like metal-binding protein YciE
VAEINARDTKLIQYLNDAYAKERELEATLRAHIPSIDRAPYKKRLQDHLRETKAHAKSVERRIRQLGGKADRVAVPDAAARVQEVASKGLDALRGTGDAEKLLKNARAQFRNEFEEIANYMSIETLAESVGDIETAKLARGIRREEERMAKFLERQIAALTKAVAKEEIPAAQRRRKPAARRKPARRPAASSAAATAKKASPRTGAKASKPRASSSARSGSPARSRAAKPRSAGSGRSASARSGSGSRSRRSRS